MEWPNPPAPPCMGLRRDGAAVCHFLLSQQACIWPCTLFKRRWISEQPFCFYYCSKGQFIGELRRIVPPKPVSKDLQPVKSQILLQSWTSVGSHAVGCSLQWAEFILFIGFCLEMSASLSSLNIWSCSISFTHARLLQFCHLWDSLPKERWCSSEVFEGKHLLSPLLT